MDVEAAMWGFILSVQGQAEAGGKHSPDLRIEAVDITAGTITITSAGTAGGTIPDIYIFIKNYAPKSVLFRYY